MPLTSNAYIKDVADLPLQYNSYLTTANVSIAVAGTYYTAATLGTLPPGLYIIGGQVLIANTTGSAAFATAKITVGGVTLTSMEGSVIATSGEVMLYCPGIAINITAAAAVLLAATSTQVGAIEYLTLQNGTPVQPTFIWAQRIK